MIYKRQNLTVKLAVKGDRVVHGQGTKVSFQWVLVYKVAGWCLGKDRCLQCKVAGWS